MAEQEIRGNDKNMNLQSTKLPPPTEYQQTEPGNCEATNKTDATLQTCLYNT